MIANMSGSSSAPTYEACEITFSGDFGTNGRDGKCTYEDEHGEFQTVSLHPYPEKIMVRKGTYVYITGNYFNLSGKCKFIDSRGYSSIFSCDYYTAAIFGCLIRGKGTIQLVFEDQ